MARRFIAAAAISMTLCAATSAIAAEKELNRSFEVATGGRLSVDVEGGTVIVSGSDTNHVVVRMRARGSEERLKELTMAAAADGQGVTVTSKRTRNGHWFGWMNGDSQLSVTVEVPRAYNVDVQTSGGGIEVKQLHGTAVGRTSGGHISVESVRGEVRMRTSGGSVTARSVHGPVQLESSGGQIVASQIDGRLSAHTSGGSIRIEQSGGSIDAQTSGGSINIDLAGANQGIVAKTSGGSVTLRLPGSTAGTLSASTSGGRVTSDMRIVSTDISKSSLRGTLNGGGPEILARSSGGSINISKRD
jgi:Putative adhesin